MKTDLISDNLLSLEKMGDEELVRRVLQGKREAFATLAHRHERSLYWIVHGILQNQEDTEEILQETFLKALRHIGDFRGESRFRTWLTQIAINEARMRLRKYRSGLYDSLDKWSEEEWDFRPRELADWRPNPEDALAKEELAELVQWGVRSLPKLYREVFLLRDIEHLSNKETATMLGISVAATKTRLLRARLMIREFLAPHFKVRWHERLLALAKRRRRSG